MLKKICAAALSLSLFLPCAPSFALEANEFKELYISENFESGFGAFKANEKTVGTVKNTVTTVTSGGNTYMRLCKNADGGDCFADVNIGLTSKKTVVEFDFKISAKGASGMLAYLRDYTSGPLQQDCVLSLSSGGTVTAKSGSYQLTENSWAHFIIFFDFENKTYTVSVNDEEIEKNAVYSALNIHSPDLFRIYAGAGRGDMCVDNFKVYSGDEVRDVSEETAEGGRSRIFPSDYHTQSVLKGKTALHAKSAYKYCGGAKRKCSAAPKEENGEFYVSAEDFSSVSGLKAADEGEYFLIGKEKFYKNTYKSSLGELSAPISDSGIPLQAAADALGISYYSDGAGLFVFTNAALSEEEISEIGKYMFFERKDAKELLESFGAACRPYVMLSAEKLEELKGSADAEFLKYKNAAIKKADSLLENFELPEYKIEDGLRLLPVCNGVEINLSYLSFAYLMTNDKKYSSAAWRIAEKVCSFPDWNADKHFLDTGVMLSAIAIYYDWCYSAMTDSQRKTVYSAVKKFAFDKAKSAYYRTDPSFNTFFATTDTNWSAVCNGSIAIAAMAMMENDPSYLSDILMNAKRALEISSYAICPDGAWSEGIGYWEWFLQHLTRFMSTYENVYGENEFLNLSGMDKFAYFGADMSSANGSNNFHDSNDSLRAPGAMLYLGEKFADKNLINAKYYFADKYNISFDIDSLCYYQKRGGSTDFAKSAYYRGVEAVSFKDSSDMFFSFHGGKNDGAHSHFDGGAFVYDCGGVRWAEDLGARDYNLSSAHGKAGFYHIRAEGHNTIVINPSEDAGQSSTANAPLVRFEENENSAIAVLDMTELYTGADSAVRGFFIGDNRRSVTIRDEIELGDDGTVYWFMHTRASAEKTGDNEFTLTKNGKSVKAVFSSNALQSAEIMQAKPLDTSPKDTVCADLDGIQKIAICLKGSGKINLTVKLFPSGEGIDEAVSKMSISDWVLQSTVNTFDDGEYNALFGRADGDRSAGGESVRLDINSPRKNLSQKISFYAAFGDRKYIELTGKKNLSSKESVLGNLIECTDGKTYVFGQEIGGFTLFKNKWYKFDALIKTGDKNTVTLYADNKCIADNIGFLAGESIEEINAAVLHGAYADDFSSESARELDILPLTFVSRDRNIRKYTVTDKGFLMYCDSRALVTQAVLSAFGKRNIKSAQLSGENVLITTSSSDVIYMPVFDLGELIYHGAEEKKELSGAYPTTLKMNFAGGDFSVKCGADEFAYSEKSLTINSAAYSAENVCSLAVSFYPQLKSMDIYVNGALFKENIPMKSTELCGWEISGDVSDILCFTGGYYCDLRADISGGTLRAKSVYDRRITAAMADFDGNKMTAVRSSDAFLTDEEQSFYLGGADKYFLLDAFDGLRPIKMQ